MKKTISHRKQMGPVCSKSDVVIWLLLPEFGLVYIPVLCGGARGVMVIVVGIGHVDTSSNPG